MRVVLVVLKVIKMTRKLSVCESVRVDGLIKAAVKGNKTIGESGLLLAIALAAIINHAEVKENETRKAEFTTDVEKDGTKSKYKITVEEIKDAHPST